MSDMALAGLIKEVLATNDWSQAEVARRATRAGCKLSDSDISIYMSKGMSTLMPAKIEALAVGLRVPSWRVASAALQDHGIFMPTDVFSPEEAVQTDTTLPPETKDALIAILRSARKRR